MTLFRKIDTDTGNFLEDVLLDSHPFLMETITETQEVFNEETGELESVEVEGERPVLDDEGNTIRDPQYIAEPVPPGFYWPKWDGEKWVEGGQAPEPTTPEPTVEERLNMAEMALLELMME